jgi:isoleucyl-tRNA synthetase
MAIDYKQTLNLPRTDFPMKADLVRREPERLARWESSRLYDQIRARRAGAEKFVLHDGPPFANGDIHIGTALNYLLKDFVIKYKTLRGYDAPFVPGWDCHGLPIESKVTEERRKKGQITAGDPATIRRACEEYARKYVEVQRAQFKRLGVFGDWEHPYLTLDKQYEADELRLFADLVEQGFIYRGKKPVYWSIPYRTALAEAEVEYQDHVSQSIYVKFPVVGHVNTYLLIWTTTPWTLPANLAVAYHSGFFYSLVRVGAEQYIVYGGLLSQIAEKCGWSGYEIVRSLDAGHLSQVQYQHPFCQRTGKLVAGDSFVDGSTGTGFVHIAPGHGLEDYLLGLDHGLPIYSPVDDDGCFIHTTDLPVEQQMPKEMLGQSTLEKHGRSPANAAVLHELRSRRALLHEENYHHSYPHCWRSKTPIIFRATDQWFLRIDHVPPAKASSVPEPMTAQFQPPGDPSQRPAPPMTTFRQLALEAIDRVRWIPEWGINRIKSTVESRPDWCISRQRTWGVPLPAFYDAQGHPILSAQVVRRVADLIEQHGSNVWFERSAADLWAAVKPKDWTGPEAVAKSNDTLDVWIDSGCSSRCVMMRRPELQHRGAGHGQAGPDWQADLYLEGSDQHRGWFQSSLLLSLAGNGAPPYRTVLTHGFMVDADREKISKSKQAQGSYEKPQSAEAYIKKWGADIMRLWVASQDFRNDIVVSDERISKVAETYRLLRNTLRYQIANLYDFDPARHTVPKDKITPLDRWVLAEFAELEKHVIAAYDAYEFHVVYQRVSQFAAVALSATYHDIVKDRLYTDAAGSHRRRSTQTALHSLLEGLCKMLAPILAFTADEAWEMIPGLPPGSSVHGAQWQTTDYVLPDGERRAWKTLFQIRERVLSELERARRNKKLGKSLEAKIVMQGPTEALAIPRRHQEELREILNVSSVDFQETPSDNVQAAARPAPESIRIVVEKVDGRKCERCWHWETDVGKHGEHPTICGRCVKSLTPG